MAEMKFDHKIAAIKELRNITSKMELQIKERTVVVTGPSLRFAIDFIEGVMALGVRYAREEEERKKKEEDRKKTITNETHSFQTVRDKYTGRHVRVLGPNTAQLIRRERGWGPHGVIVEPLEYGGMAYCCGEYELEVIR